MRRYRPHTACLAFLVLAAAPCASAEQGLIPPGQERFKINFGAVQQRSDLTLRLDAQSRRGREFSLEESAGLEKDRAVPLFQATWRIASRHRVGLRAFQIEREAQRTISEEIRLEERVIPINSTLRTESRTQFFAADYRYSFIKNSRMELAGIAGLFTVRYRFRFNATNPAIDLEKKLDIPLPVLGASVDYFVTPRWTASAFAQAMYFDAGRTNLRVYNVGVSTDYMLTRHLGVGIAYTVENIALELRKGDFRGRIDWHINNVLAYVEVRF